MYRRTRLGSTIVLLGSLAPLASAYGQSIPVVEIPAAPGTYTLSASDSLTAASLPGTTLQSNPPQLGTVPTYPSDEQDSVSPKPYASNNLQNFRFDYFDNLFDFGGYYS